MDILYSKATHINPITGYEVSNETVMLFDRKVREDGENYYVSPAFPTDNMSEKAYPKCAWDLR